MKLMALKYAGNCATCGVRVEQGVQAWFDPVTKVTCAGCRPVDSQLSVDMLASQPEAVQRTPMRSARTDLEKGAELEQKIAAVFAAAGYRVQTNVVREGRSGITHEIDVVAEKTDELLTLTVAIECKAWANPIEKDVVAKFNEARRDLGLGNALIVSLNGSQPGALGLAADLGVAVWGRDEIQSHLGKVSVLDLQNRPMVQEVGFQRGLSAAEAEQLIAKETGGRFGIGKEVIVWQGPAWVPVAVVQLTLRKYGPFQRKMATTAGWGVYDLVGGTFITRLDAEPERTPVQLDGPRIDQILKLTEPAKTIEKVISNWVKVTSDAATQRHRSEMDRLGIPEMHTAMVGTSTPFLYPVHLAVARRDAGERIVAIDCFRNRHDPDLGRELSKQITAVVSTVGA
jgi:hypothetical protein